MTKKKINHWYFLRLIVFARASRSLMPIVDAVTLLRVWLGLNWFPFFECSLFRILSLYLCWRKSQRKQKKRKEKSNKIIQFIEWNQSFLLAYRQVKRKCISFSKLKISPFVGSEWIYFRIITLCICARVDHNTSIVALTYWKWSKCIEFFT